MFCLVLAENTIEDLYGALEEGKNYTDLFELRLDYLEKIDKDSLEGILKAPYRFICTVRAKEEGGKREISPFQRWEILEFCGNKGAYLIDVEWKSLFFGKYKTLIKKSPLFPKKILFSYHNFEGTPSLKVLKVLLKRASLEGVKWFKITTLVKDFSEALELLGLISYGRDLGMEILAFGMGEVGKLSRVLCLLAGSPFTYVFFPKGRPLAPGQLDIVSAKNLYEALRNV